MRELCVITGGAGGIGLAAAKIVGRARFGKRGGRIVSVSPGTIDTSMGRLEERAGSGAMLNYAALKRFGRPEEVAELLAFCADAKAGYLTGVDIACDGGVLAAFTMKDMITVARNTQQLQ